MREIKFRAWQENRNTMIYFELGDIVGKGFAKNETMIYIDRRPLHMETVAVNVKNIMQYTGLKDKNGKDIYEGDIVLIEDENNEGEKVKSVIEWDKEGGYFVKEILWDYSPAIGSDSLEIEVVGNIYENKELLNNSGITA